MQSPLQANLERVRARIAAAASAAGRAGDDVALLAVTKSASASLVADLVRLGQRDLGENRVDVLGPKAAALAEAGLSPRWHMIGHLQRNKARRAVECASVVHSVDTLKLIETLARLAAELGRELEVFLEVRAVDAGERSGFEPGALPAAAQAVASLPHLRLRGLMAMAAPCESARAFDLGSQAPARRTFAAVRRLGDTLPLALFPSGRVEYSMGMSADLEAAVAEGSTCVRVGTALFEGLERPEARG
ncbi:MAG: YggS family pyridoxal phosphate-dependent enzyme [Planctomycetes bacterium]|nr:YggS family pyridoxal phosphate-dependent enzyme [Planctomycetota bacterium]